MSDEPDKDSRTEEATDKKLRDAAERGEMPVSRDVPQALFLGGLIAILGLVIPARTTEFVIALMHLLDDPGGWRLDQGRDAIVLFATLFAVAGKFVLPIVVVIAATGLLGSVTQNAPHLVVDRIMPKLSRISIGKGLSRLFGPRGWVELAKSVVKLFAMLGIAFYIVWASKEGMLQLVWTDVRLLPDILLSHARTLVVAHGNGDAHHCGCRRCLGPIALAARSENDKAGSQGRDPAGGRRSFDEGAFTLPANGPVASAHVGRRCRRRPWVIANPTHYAVALQYNYGQAGAPTVVAKGVDLIAFKIRALAEESQIPVIEDKPLARSLYAGGRGRPGYPT